MANNGRGINWNDRIEKQEERVLKLETNVFQLANYYFVFQGVIFTAIFSNDSSIKCHYWLVPFLLSLTAGILNLMALGTIARKYIRSLRRLEVDYSAWYRAVNGEPDQQEQPDDQGEEGEYQIRLMERQHLASRLKQWERIAILCASLLLCGGFAGINLYATAKILCHK